MARGGGKGANIELEGMEELQRKLNMILRMTWDLRPAWKIYHKAFLLAEAEYLATGKFKKLSSAYAAWKAANGYPTSPLVMTGTLRDSLTTEGKYHNFQPSQRWMLVGTTDPVGNILQRSSAVIVHGHKSQKRRPARKPVDAKSSAIQKMMREAILEHAKEYERVWGGGMVS